MTGTIWRSVFSSSAVMLMRNFYTYYWINIYPSPALILRERKRDREILINLSIHPSAASDKGFCNIRGVFSGRLSCEAALSGGLNRTAAAKPAPPEGWARV